MTLDQIKQILTDKYALSTIFEIDDVQQWAQKTQEYIKKGLSEEEAGDKSARETFSIGYGKRTVEIKSFTLMGISAIIDEIIKIK